jgi:hypothetical protein
MVFKEEQWFVKENGLLRENNGFWGTFRILKTSKGSREAT